MKFLFEDYIEKWKSGKIKEVYKVNQNASMLLMMTFITLVLGSNVGATRNNEWVYILAICIPVIFVYISAMIHPIKLDKMYYICPMSLKERKNYIIKSYMFRIFFHMLMFIPGIVVIMSMSKFRILSYIVIITNDFLISTLIPVRKVDSDKEMMCLMFLTEAMFFLNLSELVILTDKTDSHMIAQVVLICLLVFIVIPIYTIFYKYIKSELEKAAVYK